MAGKKRSMHLPPSERVIHRLEDDFGNGDAEGSFGAGIRKSQYVFPFDPR
jgi:hypothetical protein